MILTNNTKYFKYCQQYHDHGHKNIKTCRGNDKVSKQVSTRDLITSNW